ncbi:MAG: alpha/beta hydrolase fold domain-containing protein [Alphaproteobacteria bacterium]|nr:alpha/beta hydrolase fold domain-containing protein [Alphaproteobacteria bacterium]
MKSDHETGVLIQLDVPYGGGPQENLCVDTYRPAGDGPHPALLCLHGGAWLHGSQRQYESWGPWLAKRGYAVVAVDYRLSSQVSPAWPGVWDDICRSLDWLIAKASSLNIDTTRIATIGDSVGGLMAAMLSLDERTAPHIRAVVGVYGVYDLPEWWRVTRPPNRTEDPVGRLMGRPYEEAREDYESFSPVHRLREMSGKPAARYLIIYGDQDTRVPHDQSGRFLSALGEKDADFEAMRIPGAGHSWFTYAKDHSARRRVDEEPNVTVAPTLLRFLEKSVPQ